MARHDSTDGVFVRWKERHDFDCVDWRFFCEVKGKTWLTVFREGKGKTCLLLSRLTVLSGVKGKTWLNWRCLVRWKEGHDYYCVDWRCFVRWEERHDYYCLDWRCLVRWKGRHDSTDGVSWGERKDMTITVSTGGVSWGEKKDVTLTVSTDGFFVRWKERHDYYSLDWRCFVRWKESLDYCSVRFLSALARRRDCRGQT